MTDTQDQPYDAIIYIPGLAGQPFDNVASRMAAAFDTEAHSATAEFNLESGQEEDYAAHEGKNLKTRLRTISRVDPNRKPRKILDIYEFSYLDSLTKHYRDKNILLQAMRLFVLLIANLPRLLGAFRGKRQKTASEKLQYIIATGVLSLLVGYLVLLAVAVVDTVLQIPQIQALTTPSATASASSTEATSQAGQPNTNQTSPTRVGITFAQLLVILIAAIEVFFPNMKQMFIEAAVTWISMIDYLESGARSQALSGQLLALIDHISSRGYRKIHIVAYSFGTILALDNLFPTGRIPGTRMREIDTLITIGCPFDLIRVFWPDYFAERTALENVPKSWINVYSPVDVMASNFRNDPGVGQPEHKQALVTKGECTVELIPAKNIIWNVGSPKKKMSFFEFLTLAGLQAHASYWESEFETEHTAFAPITSELYQNDFPLA